MLPRAVLLGLLPIVAAPAVAQAALAAGSPEQAAAVAQAITLWIEDFERGDLAVKNSLRAGEDLQPRYVALARRAQLLRAEDEERITHLDALGKMLFFAERNPSVALADAVLGVASIGFERSFLDLTALELRETAHWTLMRMDNSGAWFLLLRAAAGEQVPILQDLRAAATPDVELAVGPARRVAALQALGRKNRPVFRATLEASLSDPDPRIRLAAAESMQPPWRLDGMRRASRALASERHPVVSQALVRLVHAMLRTAPAGLEPEERAIVCDGMLAQFGRCGWRTDMELLDVVEAFPSKDAVPMLIEALDLELRSPDALVTAINERASPLLRERAAGLLRAMTGAILLGSDPAEWREFWAREKDKIQVPVVLPRSRGEKTTAQFFGVPVTGGSIAFLIDTSGSMRDQPAGSPVTGRRGRPPGSRLSAAKEQLLLAVSAMPPGTQFYVFTFADVGRAWTKTPIKVGPQSVRSLTELLSRFGAKGGTNLGDGLVTALQLEDVRYGDAVAVKIDELFVLSDGEPTAGVVRQPDEILQMVHEANKYAKVRIHSVFTGTGGGADLLKRLADENGGVFVQR